MADAVGIHDHDDYKLGVVPHEKSDDELLEVMWAVDVESVAPTEVDHMTITPTLGRNDELGDCGPVNAANIEGIVWKYETGKAVIATNPQILTLYSFSTDPPFDPVTLANDNGVTNPDLYNAWRKHGLGGKPGPIAFGRLKDTSDASIAMAIDVFGAVTFAVDLQKAQQDQTDAATPIWDYSKSDEWGGHDICVGAISRSSGLAKCYSWAMKIGMTEAFRQNQLDEVYVPVFQSVIDSNKFNATVDRDAMASSFHNLTGGTLPASPAPTPTVITSVDLKADVATRLVHAANIKHMTPAAWLDHRLRTYFNMS